MQVHRSVAARCVGALLSVVLLGACGSGGAPDPDATAVAPATAPPAGEPTPPPPPPSAPTTPAPPTPAPTSAPPTSPPPTASTTAGPGPALLGTFPVDTAPEVSGIAASWQDPAVVWLLDDGPGTTAVLAASTDGTILAEVTMAGVEGRDTEALAIAPCGAGDATPCLYVGDIGDNAHRREVVRVHRFPEPDPRAGDAVVQVATATFTRPDGPVDAEAMVVGADGLPIILTKRHGATDVLAATDFADGPLADRGALPLPAPAAPLQSIFTGVVATDAALRRDGAALLVRTYDSAVLFTPPATGAEGLAGWEGVEVPVPYEPQGEAITWSPAVGEPTGWITASEGSGELWLTPVALL